MESPDLAAYKRLRAMSRPIPCDPSRGHELGLAAWKVVDGGVVVWRYQAFCRCYWSQRFPTGNPDIARAHYNQHLDG